MSKQDNTRPATPTKEKVLMRVSASFNALKYHIINKNDCVLTQKTGAKKASKSGVCIKLEIERENLIRIKAKNTPFESRTKSTTQKGGIKMFCLLATFLKLFKNFGLEEGVHQSI